jgi:hypothetical protein
MIFNGAIQNAICLYILLVILLFTMKPNVMNTTDDNGSYKSTRCILPIALIIIAIVCYYFFATLQLFRQ